MNMAVSLHVLVVWELGAHLGHLLKLKPLVLALLARGHQVSMLVPQVDAAQRLMDAHALLHWAACPRAAVPDAPPFVPLSYAEIIERYALPDDAAADQLYAQWQRMLAQTKPDVIVAEEAPSALLAARQHQIPVLHLASSWGLPRVLTQEAGQLQLPLLRSHPGKPHEALIQDVVQLEADLTHRANRQLRQTGVKPLRGLGDFYAQAPLNLLCTFPELDHFGVRPGAKYVGLLSSQNQGLHLEWPKQKTDGEPATRRPRVFVYLQPHRSNLDVLQTLQRLQADVIAYLPHARQQAVLKLSSHQVQITTEPVCVQPLLKGADLVINNGGHGLLCASLLAGVPLIVFPTHYEQALYVRRASETGAVFLMHREETGARFDALARRLLNEPSAKAAAAAFAAKYVGYDMAETVRKLVKTVEDMGKGRVAKADLSDRERLSEAASPVGET